MSLDNRGERQYECCRKELDPVLFLSASTRSCHEVLHRSTNSVWNLAGKPHPVKIFASWAARDEENRGERIRLAGEGSVCTEVASIIVTLWIWVLRWLCGCDSRRSKWRIRITAFVTENSLKSRTLLRSCCHDSRVCHGQRQSSARHSIGVNRLRGATGEWQSA